MKKIVILVIVLAIFLVACGDDENMLGVDKGGAKAACYPEIRTGVWFDNHSDGQYRSRFLIREMTELEYTQYCEGE